MVVCSNKVHGIFAASTTLLPEAYLLNIIELLSFLILKGNTF